MTGITSWNSDDEVKKPLSNQASIESLRVEEKTITISQDLTWCKPLLTTLYFVGPPPQCEIFKCIPKCICISLRNIAKDALVEQPTPWLWKHGWWKQYPFQWALSLSPKTHLETLVMFWWTMCVFFKKQKNQNLDSSMFNIQIINRAQRWSIRHTQERQIENVKRTMLQGANVEVVQVYQRAWKFVTPGDRYWYLRKKKTSSWRVDCQIPFPTDMALYQL